MEVGTKRRYNTVLLSTIQGCWYVLSPTRTETSYSDRRFWCSYILFIIIIGGILVLFIHITRSDRGFCNGLITRPEESYRLWHVFVCDQKPRTRGGYSPATGLQNTNPQWVVEPVKKQIYIYIYNKTSIKRNILTIKQNTSISRSG